MRYSVDTSALMNAWVRHYPPSVFASLGKRIDDLIEVDRFVAPDEVLRELAQKEDALHEWVKQRPRMLVPPDAAIQRRVSQIMNRFPSLTNANSLMSGAADPFVIALAAEQNLTVVTDETSKPTKPSTRVESTVLPQPILSCH